MTSNSTLSLASASISTNATIVNATSILAAMSTSPPPPDAEWSNGLPAAYVALMTVNSLSIFCCLMVLAVFAMSRRWYPRIMRRLSLRLVACMAAVELILHTSNLVGYGKLPTDGFVCGLMGGFFFAYGSLTSLFYACAVALNCQLVFVFAKRPTQTKEKLFVILPPILALAICLPTLATGLYGYDQQLEYCWYSTANASSQTVLARMVGTFGIWAFLAVAYLIFSCITIIRAVFSPNSQCLQVSATVDGFAAPSQTIDVISRRHHAVRRLVFRLLGFIAVPCICVVTGVVLDILVKTGVDVSAEVDATFEIMSGLAGTFNGILFLIDPAMLAIKDNRFTAIDDDDTLRPRPYTMSAWTARISDESLDVEKSIVQDARSRRFRELESDLDGL